MCSDMQPWRARVGPVADPIREPPNDRAREMFGVAGKAITPPTIDVFQPGRAVRAATTETLRRKHKKKGTTNRSSLYSAVLRAAPKPSRQRHRSESNRRIADLQSAALP